MAPDAVHPAAAIGFDREAASYERARPSYPDAAVEFVLDRLDLGDGRRVLDLAAGTGKFTRLLLPSGAAVVAVEPVAGMRERLTASLPEVEVLDGTAESIPLLDGSVRGVVCAQAFHWFDGPAALIEIGRVLVPGGGLAVVYNIRDESVPWVAELTRITGVMDANRPHHRETRRDLPHWLEHDSYMSFESVERFRLRQPMTPELLVERVVSQSWIAAMDADEREPLLDRVRDLARSHPDLSGRDEFDLPYDTEVMICRRR